MKFWGYRHKKGTHHVRRIVSEDAAKESIVDALSSPNVDILIEPFDAHDIADARGKLKKLIAEAEAEA